MKIDELIDHAQECHIVANLFDIAGVANLFDIAGNHETAKKIRQWAERAEYRAIQIEMGYPDPAEEKPVFFLDNAIKS